MHHRMITAHQGGVTRIYGRPPAVANRYQNTCPAHAGFPRWLLSSKILLPQYTGFTRHGKYRFYDNRLGI